MTTPFTPDDEMLMAYADGELDPLNTKRVEKAMAADPALAKAVEDHRALRRALGGAFAPILDEPVPDHLAAMLRSNVVPITVPAVPAPKPKRWLGGLAIAASLVAGIGVGTQWQASTSPVTMKNGLVASGNLAGILNQNLASQAGETRILVSFREKNGQYCRAFAAPSLDGIACRNGDDWLLRQMRSVDIHRNTTYAQAGSDHAPIMAAAQDMLQDEPLDEAAEKRAIAAGWR